MNTTQASSPSNHPFAGNTSWVRAVLGFMFDMAAAALLAMFLTGNISLGNGKFQLLAPELLYPWEVLAPVAAIIFYRIDAATSRRRPRTKGAAILDFLGTLAVLVILFGAAASWVPPIAHKYQALGLPVSLFNAFNFAVVVSFSVAVIFHARRYHIERAEVGLEAVEAGSATVPKPVIESSSATIVGSDDTLVGRTVIVHGNVHNIVVADPSQVVKVRPHVVAGKDVAAA